MDMSASFPRDSRVLPSVRSKRRASSSLQLKGDIPAVHSHVPPIAEDDPFRFEEEDDEGDISTDEEYVENKESSDEEEEEEKAVRVDSWTTVPQQFTVPTFVLAAAPSRAARRMSSPLQMLRLFLTSELMNGIVTSTNQYGASIFEENWVPTTAAEMDRLFSAVIYMGIFRHPTLQSYWSNEARSPFISKLFPSRDRFLLLYRSFYIHPGERNANDPLWHVRPLISSLSLSFQSHFTPSQVLVLDEAMVPCKARSIMKQYIKNKHT